MWLICMPLQAQGNVKFSYGSTSEQGSSYGTFKSITQVSEEHMSQWPLTFVTYLSSMGLCYYGDWNDLLYFLEGRREAEMRFGVMCFKFWGEYLINRLIN